MNTRDSESDLSNFLIALPIYSPESRELMVAGILRLMLDIFYFKSVIVIDFGSISSQGEEKRRMSLLHPECQTRYKRRKEQPQYLQCPRRIQSQLTRESGMD